MAETLQPDPSNVMGPSADERTAELSAESLQQLEERVREIGQRIAASPLAAKLIDGRKPCHPFGPDEQAAYLVALAQSGRKGDSAAFAGVSLWSVQKIRREDEDFAELEQSALELYRDRVRRAIEEEGVEGSLVPVILRDSEGAEQIAGWRRVRNPKILELAAKLLLPEYRDRVEVSGGVELSVGVLAVPTGGSSSEDWSERHGGRKLVRNESAQSDAEPEKTAPEGVTKT